MDKNQVYQDPITKALFTFKYRWKGWVIIGGGDGFYGDAIFALTRYKISENYFAKFIAIKDTDEFLENDRIGWKVKNWDCVNNDWIFHNLRDSKDIKSFGGDMNANRKYKQNCEEIEYLTDYYHDYEEANL